VLLRPRRGAGRINRRQRILLLHRIHEFGVIICIITGVFVVAAN
jgi:hypothetical protein